jgi:ABC-type multidrug transport system permease subunit
MLKWWWLQFYAWVLSLLVCVFFSKHFFVVCCCKNSMMDRLTFLPLSLFFLSPYLLSVQFVLLYNSLTIVAKSARAPWVCSIGTSLECSKITSLWVCSFLDNNAHKVHIHHMKFDNNQEGYSFLSLVCVFLFLSIYHLHVFVGTKEKMWRLVTVKKVGALPTPLSLPFVFILFVVYLILLLLPLPCLCYVVGTKVKGSCGQ